MESRLKKGIYLLLLQISMIVFTLCPSVLYYGNLTIKGLSTTPVIVEEPSAPRYSVPLSDSYGRNGQSLDQFLNSEGVLKDLVEINHQLNHSENFAYYQLTEASIYYEGDYTGRASTICGGEEYRNQTDIETGELITSLNSMEISESLSDQIQKRLKAGRSFSEGDFSLTYEDVIPVILGNEYRETLSIGDKLKLRYYLDEIAVEVVGFLEEGAIMKLPSFYSEIDGYMVLPDIKIPKENYEKQRKNDIIMMLEKCEGYLGLYRTDDFAQTIEELKSISGKYDFAINIDAIQTTFSYLEEQAELEEAAENKTGSDAAGKEQKKEEIINIDNKLSRTQNTLLWVFTGLSGAGILCCLRRLLTSAGPCPENMRMVVFKTKAAALFTFGMIAAYAVSYAVYKIVFTCVYGSFHGGASYPQSWVRLALLIVIVTGNILLCRSIGRSPGDGEENA